MKKILVILDGAADLPIEVFGGKTPLEAANTPNLDFFSETGKLGYMYPIDEETAPGSDTSLVSLFGNNPKECRRGIYEAVGVKAQFKKGDIAFRANFATIDNLKSRRVIDRRAGRTLTTKDAYYLAKSINNQVKLSCDFEFIPGIQHRAVLILRGGFSDNISNTDPEWSPGAVNVFNFSESLDDRENSKYTAKVLNEFLFQANKVLENHPINLKRISKGLLPANFIFTRGGGIEKPKLRQYKTWMSINPMPLEIGLSELSGMKVFSFSYPDLKDIDSYENLYNGLKQSIKFAIKIIRKKHKHYSGCYIQLKETDIPGHDNKPYEKKNMIELIDREFFSFLREFVRDKEIKIVVTCDHSTPCKLKTHSSDPVPVLVYESDLEHKDSKKYNSNPQRFCENRAKKGVLGKIYGKDFIKKTGLND